MVDHGHRRPRSTRGLDVGPALVREQGRGAGSRGDRQLDPSLAGCRRPIRRAPAHRPCAGQARAVPGAARLPSAIRCPASARQIELLEDGRRVYDAPHDPGFGVALLKLISEGAEIDGDRMRVAGRGRGASGLVRCRVLAGEQSNTSIVLEGDGAPVICKVFRALHDGDNPDVELQSALAEAGSTAVPPAVGHVVGDWTDSGTVSGRAVGHLAVRAGVPARRTRRLGHRARRGPSRPNLRAARLRRSGKPPPTSTRGLRGR